ncbi:NAD(P)/FAD-dependent oxidoreductase [Kitasatospora sp. NPDC059827]|uniref:NAD(P)/FAD-dependent oxidoreductase n=1 Tax=Kitasatospora sp. NPDC059827 TaxID=3346964 RepID=UPI0036495E65
MSGHGTYDLAVIGTGIVGATAVGLAALRHPDASVVAVCAGAVHDGSTVRSLAVDIPAGRTEEQRALARRSLELRAELASLAPALNAEVRRAYWVVPAGGAAGVDGQLVGDALAPCRSEQEAQLRAVFGGPVGGAGTELRRSAEATFSEPAEAVEQLLRPLTDGGPAAGSLAAGSLTARPLAAGSRADGPRRDLVEGFAVRAVEPCADGYRLIAEDGGELTARRVLAAPGAATLTGPFAATAKRLGARTKKVVAYRLRGGEPGGHRPLLVLDEPDAFLLPVGEGRDWYYSITSTDWDCPPERTRLAPNPADRALAEAVLAEQLPGFRPEFIGCRTGADLYLPDFAPLITPLDGLDGVVLATGGAGSGFRLAPAMAEGALALLGLD